MSRPATPILDYAHPAGWRRRRLRDLPGVVAIPAALGMTAASFFTALYAAVEEPFYNWPADPVDVFVCWVMPLLIAPGWVAWGVLTLRRGRPRWLAAIVLVLGLHAFCWSIWLIHQANSSYRMDRARVAEWKAEEAAAATAPAAE